jgi:hypothetical protein
MSTKSMQPWEWDIRVRERNLKKGTLTASEVEKYLADLADLASRADTVLQPQPAIGKGHEYAIIRGKD